MKKRKLIIGIFLLIIVLVAAFLFLPKNFAGKVLQGSETPEFVEISAIKAPDTKVSLDENEIATFVKELKLLKLRWSGSVSDKSPVGDSIYMVKIKEAGKTMHTEFIIDAAGEVYFNGGKYKVVGDMTELLKMIKVK